MIRLRSIRFFFFFLPGESSFFGKDFSTTMLFILCSRFDSNKEVEYSNLFFFFENFLLENIF